MTHADDPRLVEAKAIPMANVVDRLGIVGLKRQSGELIGPCPLCGGRDRFGINLRTGAFLCRKCDLRGGDQIALVRGVQGVDFKAALTWLCGNAPAEIDEAERARRRRKAAEAERKQREAQERYRRKAISDARTIWSKARPGHLGVVRAYLQSRGFTEQLLPEIPTALRFIVEHPYVKKIGRELVTVHRGPCMIAGILNPAGELTAVHQTWVDRDPPHSKARIQFEGEDMPAKLVRGSKKAGAIRLSTPPGSEALVMGEGIETTLTAMVVGHYPNAAYWAGVDLGNMAGRMKKVEGRRYSGLPDMSDRDAFVPPDWVKRLVFIMDGDSDPVMTRAKLDCGLRRAMAVRPGLKAQIIHAGAGVDLNDLLMGKADG
ncbi:DUF7146 domain-containing protein [Palleronia caenipelagi]|uniref:Uncharacterized protein n=1 Tax=Palleronia caenipelagi TaxID=2489174 RepID=A0A547Q679_9RHOB|nr:primase-helicase zinc-binding domain-containing protein [Palleronia caenipelagi]TRD21895.1 hypothetical protein FEV53_07550 [Palleronia caenipelagi]